MARTLPCFAVFALVLLFSNVQASDPELLTDFAIPSGLNEAKIDGTFFTFTGFRGGAPSFFPGGLGKKSATIKEFPALNGMGVSMELLEFAPGAVNVPHTHRAGEILFVVDGTLIVGTIDGSGKLYKNVLQKGDVFMFPKGLPHYQANLDHCNKAVAVTAFGSANAGTVSLPKTIFGSNIPDEVLTKAFKISADTVHQLTTAQH